MVLDFWLAFRNLSVDVRVFRHMKQNGRRSEK